MPRVDNSHKCLHVDVINYVPTSSKYPSSKHPTFSAVIDSLWQSSIAPVMNPLQSHWLLAVVEMIGDNN